MRSEEREEKNAPAEKESGDAALPAVRWRDAKSRGVLGEVLEVSEQAVPMADVGELEGEEMKSDCCGALVGEHHGWTIKKGIENPKSTLDYELTDRRPYCLKCGEFCNPVENKQKVIEEK